MDYSDKSHFPGETRGLFYCLLHSSPSISYAAGFFQIFIAEKIKTADIREKKNKV